MIKSYNLHCVKRVYKVSYSLHTNFKLPPILASTARGLKHFNRKVVNRSIYAIRFCVRFRIRQFVYPLQLKQKTREVQRKSGISD